MRTFCIALICMASTIASAQADKPYDYRGNILGVTTSEQIKPLSPCSKAADGVLNCDVASDLPLDYDTPGSTQTAYYTFVGDKLATVDVSFVSALSLDGLLKGLTAKFGKPVVTTATYRNGLGVSFTAHVWIWMNSLSEIELNEQQPNGESGTGLLIYGDIKLVAKLNTAQPPSL